MKLQLIDLRRQIYKSTTIWTQVWTQLNYQQKIRSLPKTFHYGRGKSRSQKFHSSRSTRKVWYRIVAKWENLQPKSKFQFQYKTDSFIKKHYRRKYKKKYARHISTLPSCWKLGTMLNIQYTHITSHKVHHRVWK